ncbi:MAG TPA: hypothetical protein VGU23_05625 [Acidobacteriaceae bacterium]|nr:hypothetical protein [Acidobacteriaceae bacterium]
MSPLNPQARPRLPGMLGLMVTASKVVGSVWEGRAAFCCASATGTAISIDRAASRKLLVPCAMLAVISLGFSFWLAGAAVFF